MSKKKRAKVAKVPCPHCGKPQKPEDITTCPQCYREACEGMQCIMPMGSGVICMKCEEKDAQ